MSVHSNFNHIGDKRARIPQALRGGFMRSKLLRGMTYKDTFTENDMPTHSSSGDFCVDLFGSVGAARNWSDEQIVWAFEKALEQDPLIAMRILFWARDIRGGAGERRVFRVCLDYLDKNYKYYLEKNLHLVPEYGRWDDIFHLENNNVFEFIKVGLANKDALLAKWLPRKGNFANKVRRFLNITPKQYRKLIVGMSKTVDI